MHDETRLRAFLAPLWAGPVHGPPGCEDWRDLMRRLSRPGRNERICAEVYRYFLGVLPPHYHGGDFFAFCEGREPVRLFRRAGGRYVCRRLSWEETVTFCDLAGIDLPD
jgi:hypothetical protein